MQTKSSFFHTLCKADPFFLISGVNVLGEVQLAAHDLRVAEHLKRLSVDLKIPVVFKASFDKANRTAINGFRGPGLEAGLRQLQQVKQFTDLPIITDVHETIQVDQVAEVADIIQIPAFLCRQTDLIIKASKTGKVILIKKGQFASADVMVNAADKVRSVHNDQVILCERGHSFGYSDLIVDMRSLVHMRQKARCPVVMDVTHSLQKPAQIITENGERASGGCRTFLQTIARAAVAVGVDGLFLEIHEDPDTAPVDRAVQLQVKELRPLLQELSDIARATKARS